MRLQRSLWLAVAALPLALAAPLHAGPPTVGTEVHVNLSSDFKPHNPVAAFDNAGRSLVVWENEETGLRGRFFARDGSPLGTELALVRNQTLPSIPAHGNVVTRKEPAVTFLTNGSFFLFWTEESAYLSVDYFYEQRQVLDRDAFGQRFSAAGVAIGQPFRLSASSDGFQQRPKALLRPGGDLIVVWESHGLQGRLFNTAGQPLTNEFQVNDRGGRQVQNAALAGDSTGRFLVTWESCCGDGDGLGVFARLFDRSGLPAGSDVLVNTATTGIQRRPAAAADGRGNFLVVWQGRYQDADHARIYGQFVGAAGNLVGPQFRVSQGLGTVQISPSVALEPSGKFVVAWIDWQDIFPLGIFGVEIDRLGNPTASEFEINSAPVNSQFRLSIAGNGSGAFLIPWEGFTGDTVGITARRLTTQ
jgi:hypothetical protein